MVRGATQREIRESLRKPGLGTEDYLCQTCVLEPTDIDVNSYEAGCISMLANVIMDVSGMGEENPDTRKKLGLPDANYADRFVAESVE